MSHDMAGLDGYGDEHGEDQEDEHAEAVEAATAPPPPRRVTRTRAPTDRAAVTLPGIGGLPRRAVAWGVERRTPIGTWERLTGPSVDGKMDVNEWPIEILTADHVRERFGVGTFRVRWVGRNEGNARVSCGTSPEFTFRAPEPAPAPAPAPTLGAPMGGGIDAFALMDVIDRRATGQVSTMLQLAQMARGDGGAGALTVVVEMMRTQAEQTRQMIEAMREESRAQAASLRALVEGGGAGGGDDDEDDEGESVAETAARVVARRPKSWGDLLRGLVAENPAIVGDLLRAAPAVVNALSQAAAVAPPPAAVQPPALHGAQASAGTHAGGVPARRVVVTPASPASASVAPPPSSAPVVEPEAAPAPPMPGINAAAAVPS